MAEKGWTARVAAAAGAAAGTGAAQLGLGYGLGVVVWPTVETPDDNVWLGSLGWATWITASATVFGAVIASRLGGGPATRTRGPWRLALATSAAVGALVAVALIALPAGSEVREGTLSHQVIAGGYAMVGLVIGLVVAYWAVVSRPVAANLITTAAWLWALAISAIVVNLTMHRSSATYLTSWQFAEPSSDHRYGTIFWPSAALTLAAAFLIGVLAVIPAARRGHLGLGSATSGAVGPLLVAVAFFVLAPRLTGTLGPLESAYLIAPYAVLAGLAGSALVVAIAQAAANRQARRAAPALATGVATVPAADLPEPESTPEPSRSPSPKGRAKPAPTAPGGKGDPAGPATSAGSAAVPKQSAGPPAAASTSPRSTSPVAPDPASSGSTSPVDPDSTDAGKPWDMAPGAKPSRSTSPAPTPAPSGRGPAQPASDQSRASTTQPASDRSPMGTAQPASEKPSTGTAQSANDEAKTGTTRPTNDKPTTGTAQSAGNPSRPGAAQAGSRSGTTQPGPQSQAVRGTAQPASGSGQASPSDKSPGTPAGSGSAGTGTPGARPSGTRPTPGNNPDEDFDSEIAAAARPRGRFKKAAPLRKSPDAVPDKAPKSTVTPPPTTPTIAQINPKPAQPD